MSTARTPEQNGVVERRNRTLVEADRTMISAAKIPLIFWPEAIATACFTQNRSLVIPRHEKTPYHIINARKPSVKFFYIFGSLCYIVRDGENLDKMKGYSTQLRAYRVINKRIRIIVETIHVSFDELPQMASDHVSSDPVPQGPTTVLEQDSLSPGPQSLENVPHVAETVTTSNELDLLFSPMFDELLNGTTLVVSKSSAVHAADAPNKRQQQHTTPYTSTIVAADTPPLNIQTTPVTTSQAPTQLPTVTATENIIQAEINNENAQVDDDEFLTGYAQKEEIDSKVICKPVGSVEGCPVVQFCYSSTQMHLPYNQIETSKTTFLYGPLKEEIHQSPHGIFINQAKYAQDILKKHGMTSCDSIGNSCQWHETTNADLSGADVIGSLNDGALWSDKKIPDSAFLVSADKPRCQGDSGVRRSIRHE
ncbi:retrovirus-related pol polyprotein from transposon TNT 1-94, partial [Tanacetum coccineum]